jgi:hypothetical protein
VRIPWHPAKLENWDWIDPLSLEDSFRRYNDAGFPMLIECNVLVGTPFYVRICGQVVCLLRLATSDEREAANNAGLMPRRQHSLPYTYVVVTD